jgi:anaerobic selenocysteine-containing dehydrogenase
MTAVEEKSVICASCDIACMVVACVKEGRVTRVRAVRKPGQSKNICVKGIYAPKSFNHPERVLFPLKRVGERGSGQWSRVSWDEAMDDIGDRLSKVVDSYGPESLVVSTSAWNTSVDNGSGRRFMNLLGSPNWISGVAVCAGNTAAINRMVYGWFPQPDYSATKCIVLFGHNPKRHSWTPVYNKIRSAQARGAKLIVLDPRRSENAELADLWLPLSAGTDAAMMLGWLNVIISEGLYDKEFVTRWTIGFDALKLRVEEYPVDRVAAITGVNPELIREAARLYAMTKPGIIPWTPITDQQISSTSAIRLQCILRALAGNVDVRGGEILQGLNPFVVSESELELHEVLSDKQKAKQLGSDKHPAFTYRGMAALKEATERVWGRPYMNQLTGCYMANPAATFRAMAHGDPYPVKAFFSLGNNTLLGYSNMRLIYDAIMNQDLVVVHEHMKTPTAQLADYILPGDSWLERPVLFDAFGWSSVIAASEKASEPPGECRSVYDFWRELALRMELGEHFPWRTLEELYDYRLSATGMSFSEFCAKQKVSAPKPQYRKYETAGFATPSGKVELSSSVLENLGFDPLPYYREAPLPSLEFPLALIMGVREDGFFQTGHRHVPELRRLHPEPKLFVNPVTAREHGLIEGDWACIETRGGRMFSITELRPELPRGLVRVPHGWWKPETRQGKESLSSAWLYSDATITIDDEDYRDLEQGVPHLKGIPCRVSHVARPPFEQRRLEEVDTPDFEAAELN